MRVYETVLVRTYEEDIYIPLQTAVDPCMIDVKHGFLFCFVLFFCFFGVPLQWFAMRKGDKERQFPIHRRIQAPRWVTRTEGIEKLGVFARGVPTWMTTYVAL